MRKLFLDDIRVPKDVTYMPSLTRFYYETDWDIVRNYEEFKNYLENNNMPDIISFDHDLADEHYTPKEYWDDYEKSKLYQESLIYKEKTGLDCAKFLIEHINNNNLELPEIYCHSMNPVGKDNILNQIESYRKWRIRNV